MLCLQLSSYALGLVFIVIVAIIWSAASILVQYLYHEQSFDAPFLLTYIGTSLFVVLLPIHRLYEKWIEYRSNESNNNNLVIGIYQNLSTDNNDDDDVHGNKWIKSCRHNPRSHLQQLWE